MPRRTATKALSAVPDSPDSPEVPDSPADMDTLDGFDAGVDQPELFDLDPEPADAGSGRRRRGVRVPRAGGRTTKAREGRLKAELHTYLLVCAGPIELRDEVCGGALTEQSEPIAEHLARIIGRYPGMADKILESGILGDIAGLVMATWPVIRTVREHHGRGSTGNDGSAVDLDAFPPYLPDNR